MYIYIRTYTHIYLSIYLSSTHYLPRAAPDSPLGCRRRAHRGRHVCVCIYTFIYLHTHTRTHTSIYLARGSLTRAALDSLY